MKLFLRYILFCVYTWKYIFFIGTLSFPCRSIKKFQISQNVPRNIIKPTEIRLKNTEKIRKNIHLTIWWWISRMFYASCSPTLCTCAINWHNSFQDFCISYVLPVHNHYQLQNFNLQISAQRSYCWIYIVYIILYPVHPILSPPYTPSPVSMN